jgi:hypothetical protein
MHDFYKIQQLFYLVRVMERKGVRWFLLHDVSTELEIEKKKEQKMSKDCSTKNAQRSTFLFVFVWKTQSAISSSPPPVPYWHPLLNFKLSFVSSTSHPFLFSYGPRWPSCVPAYNEYSSVTEANPLAPPPAQLLWGRIERIADTENSAGSFAAAGVAGGVRLAYTFVDNKCWALCILVLELLWA